MGQKDSRVDAYIAKSPDFAQPILAHLRELVHAACPEVEETMKWSFPNFMYKGMLCSMAAFKAHCALSFWKASLIFGNGEGATGKEKGSMGHFGRITALSDLPKDKELLAHIKEAVRLNEAGISKPRPRPKAKKELVVPDYFMAALKKNKTALATFEGFPYSHKKEYLEWITEAKAEETRQRRIATALEWMAEGKSRNWKYMNC